jgi:glycosyltransferase involved in cell wall biosynthesis
MEKVDVVMLTKNSERWLGACLKSIYENVPVNRLIVIDAFSTDSTLKIFDEFNRRYGNVKIISERSSRGKARERGISEASTEWFMFVDSDVTLSKEWFKKASEQIHDDVGAIWGVDVPGNVKNKFLTRLMQSIEARVFNIRGGCHDILIRHDAVEGIKIPSELHTLEDAYIKEWIRAKNYKVIASYEPYCKHYKEMGSLLSRENTLSTVSEFKRLRLVKERLLYAPIFALLWLLHEVESKSRK